MTTPPAPPTSASSYAASSPSSQSGSGIPSSSMKATMSPAAASIPRLRDFPRCASGQLTARSSLERSERSPSVSSVEGPLTTTTSKFACV
jgi:hypothetical protein